MATNYKAELEMKLQTDQNGVVKECKCEKINIQADDDGGEINPIKPEQNNVVYLDATNIVAVNYDDNNNQVESIDDDVSNAIQKPNSNFPKPERPPGICKSRLNVDVLVQRSKSLKDILQARGNTFSAAIAKRFNSFKGISNGKVIDDDKTEFDISDLKVVVRRKNDVLDGIKGRITFFSRSNCRDCTAVRSLFRQRSLPYVEVNLDVYPYREKEMIERTGSSQVPQIFFNEEFFGGLVALNSLRNSGEFDDRLRKLLGKKCSGGVPPSPVYGFDDPQGEESTDEMLTIVKMLRKKLPIQDRLMKMKLVKNCFSGSEMVDVIVRDLDCGRPKAIEIGKKLAMKHFIHNVFGDSEFEDENNFYRFLEHELHIPKCYNSLGFTNDSEPKPVVVVGTRLTKIMSAILESYASDDRVHVDYLRIAGTEEFRRYTNLTQDLQRVDLYELSSDERLAFFLNLYNVMAIHAIIRVGCPQRVIDSRTFYSEFQYIVGGYAYSLNTVKHGILRNNRRPPYSLVKLLGNGDNRLGLAINRVNPLIHFGLCDGTRSSPVVKVFTASTVEAELRSAAREFFIWSRINVDLDKRTVCLPKIIKWYSVDFGQEKEILKWVVEYVDATEAGLLTHLLNDEGNVSVVYEKYNWSVNN